jgi:hypothetical protein
MGLVSISSFGSTTPLSYSYTNMDSMSGTSAGMYAGAIVSGYTGIEVFYAGAMSTVNYFTSAKSYGSIL